MKIEFEIAGKKCSFYKDCTEAEHAELRSLLSKWDKSGDLWTKTQENMRGQNHGSTIITSKHVLVVLSPQTSKAELLNTLAHETRHITDALAPEIDLPAPEITGIIFSHYAEWL